MSTNYKEYKFSDLIEEVEERNTSLEYGLDDIVGVTIEKGMIPTIANLIQTALDKFYIVKPDTFVYNPRTHGVRLGMGYNDTNKIFLTSWNNVAFRVKEDAKKIVLSKYLWIYFNRPEWDRQTNFMAWGSSTIVFAWNDFLSIKIKLPDLKEQEKIVNTYNAITKRIQLKKKINENLEKTAQCLFEKTIAQKEKNGKLNDIATITMGQSPDGDSYNENGNGEVFYQGKSDFGNRFVSERVFTTAPTRIANPKDILLSVRAPVGVINITQKKCCIGRGLAAISSKNKQNSFLFYTLKSLSPAFEIFNGEGTVFGSINREGLENLEIVIPDNNEITEFEKYASKIDKEIENNEIEISKLQELKQLVISRISGM